MLLEHPWLVSKVSPDWGNGVPLREVHDSRQSLLPYKQFPLGAIIIQDTWSKPLHRKYDDKGLERRLQECIAELVPRIALEEIPFIGCLGFVARF